MNAVALIKMDFLRPVPTLIHAVQNDKNARKIRMLITAGGSVFDPTGLTVTFRYKKPDGSCGDYSTLEDNITPAYTVESDKSLTITLVEQVLTVPGEVLCEVNFYDGGEKLTTLAFTVLVAPSVLADATIVSSDYNNVLTAEINNAKTALAAYVGAPLVAATAAAMTDHERVYVYTGSETGYTSGSWYFWDGSDWTAGGTYQAAAVVTDTTLTDSGVAADAEATGNRIAEISEFVEKAKVTSTVSRTSYGVTFTAMEDGSLKVYGQGTAARRFCFLNGQDVVKITTSEFSKTLDAGTYDISATLTGPTNYFALDATYTTFSSRFNLLLIGSLSTTVTFTAPVMIGMAFDSSANFGTSDNPTYIKISAKKRSAVDLVARSDVEALQTTEATDVATLGAAIDGIDSDIAGINTNIFRFNQYNAIEYGNGTSAEKNGVTFTNNEDGTWTVDGTAEDTTFNNIINSSTSVPAYITPGRTYVFSMNGGTVPVRLYVYASSGNYNNDYSTDAEITFPDDLTGVILRFQVASGASFDSETVRYTLIPKNGAVINNSYSYSTTVQKTEQIISNTYDLDVSPTITTDSNGWLAAVDEESSSETGKTDMTPAIMAMLQSTGYCHLGEGIFYVSGNIDMPKHSVLVGCGKATKIRLLQSVTAGYTIKMEEFCTVSDLWVNGSRLVLSLDEEGYRHGILFAANCDGNEGETESTTSHSMISNVWISQFSGSGIKCHNTSINYAGGLWAMNVYIERCWVGINIDYKAEFCKFTNICTNHCKTACVNNGGNNVFTACTFHAKSVGFLIDGTQPNSAHGSMVGCTFCHIGNNAGSAITINDVSNGFVIADCQIWYNSIDLTNCEGIVFDGCEFGRGTTGDGATITITGGNTILFNGCMFMNDVNRPPDITITNNSKVRFVGCYGSASGDEIVG